MGMDSAQHFFQVFGAELTEDIDIVYPCSLSPTNCPYTSTPARNRVELMNSDESIVQGTAVDHELGHALVLQEFGRDYPNDDCTLNGGGHTPTSVEYESCATYEGFGDFIGIASWWDVSNTSSDPHAWGYDWEITAPHVSAKQDAG